MSDIPSNSIVNDANRDLIVDVVLLAPAVARHLTTDDAELDKKFSPAAIQLASEKSKKRARSSPKKKAPRPSPKTKQAKSDADENDLVIKPLELADGRLGCPNCDMGPYRNRKSYVAHRHKEHSIIERLTVQCPVQGCDVAATTKNTLINHMIIDHFFVVKNFEDEHENMASFEEFPLIRMGSRMSCTCDSRRCRNAFRSGSFGEQSRVFRFWAELYELSSDRAHWRLLSTELVSFTLTQLTEHSRLVALDHRFKPLLDTTITNESGVVRGAACFVYWRDQIPESTRDLSTSLSISDGFNKAGMITASTSSSSSRHFAATGRVLQHRRRAIGVNLLCREDADCFVELAGRREQQGGRHLQGALDMRYSPYLSMPSLIRHEPYWVTCTVRIQYAVVSIQTDSLTIPLDLANLMISTGANERELVLSDGTSAFLLEADDQHLVAEWRRRILVVAALAKSRVDSLNSAINYVNRELDKNREKIHTMSKMLEIAAGSPLMTRISKEQVCDWQNDLELSHLRHFALKSYAAALQHQKPPSERDLMANCTPSTRRYLAARGLNCLAAMHLHVAYSARFPAANPMPISISEHDEETAMISSFRTQCSMDSIEDGREMFGSYLSACTQSSSYSLSEQLHPPLSIYLPRGQTFIVEPAYTSSEERVLDRVCQQLQLDKDKYFLQGYSQDHPQSRVRLQRCGEYEIERNGERLGLTICARSDTSGVYAEVTAMRGSCGRVRIGDRVISVDGQSVNAMPSAADVQTALALGNRLRLRTKRVLTSSPASSSSSRARQDLHRHHRLSMPPTPTTTVANGGGGGQDSLDSVSVRSSPARSSCRREPWRLATRIGKAWSSEPRMADDAELKMTRLLGELVATENAYVEHLKQLIVRYLAPAELALLEAARRVLRVQKTFERDLCEAAGDVAKPGTSNSTGQIRDAVLRVSTLFINKCSKFKVYSEYSAAHLSLQKQLLENPQLQKKCAALNVGGDQSSNLESLMIKPIQRVLRYPLFLQEMKRICAARSVEATQIAEALRRAEQLALYINEMQRLFEEYGSALEQINVFNKTLLQQKALSIDLSGLLMFGHVQWLNGDERRPIDAAVFVFQSTILLLCPANSKKVRPHRLISVVDVEVNSNESSNGSTDNTQHIFVLIDLAGPGERVYQLACCQSQMKKHFIRAIRKAAIMSKSISNRPLSELSQSDGGYGSFGDPHEQNHQLDKVK